MKRVRKVIGAAVATAILAASGRGQGTANSDKPRAQETAPLLSPPKPAPLHAAAEQQGPKVQVRSSEPPAVRSSDAPGAQRSADDEEQQQRLREEVRLFLAAHPGLRDQIKREVDDDGDGKLTPVEQMRACELLRRAMAAARAAQGGLVEEPLDEVSRRMDRDGDGRISPLERELAERAKVRIERSNGILLGILLGRREGNAVDRETRPSGVQSQQGAPRLPPARTGAATGTLQARPGSGR